MMGKIVTLGMGIIFIIGCGSSPGDSFYEIDISKPEEGENFTIPTEPGQIGVEATNIPVERNSDPEWYMAENTLAWEFTSHYDPRPTVSKGTLSKSSLYDNNDDFGDHTVTVSFVDTSGDTQANGVTVQIFYQRDDWKGGTPAWYYFWKQTSAHVGISEYSSSCIGNEKGYFLPSDPYQYYVCWFDVYDVNPQTGHWGIDFFAEICRHENIHYNDFWNFWPGGYDPGNDGDGDYLPDDQEPGLGYDPSEKDTFGDGYDFDFKRYTEKHLEEVGIQWNDGSANGEDWSYPGKQWL